MTVWLSRFLLFHALATFAAGVVLIVTPGLIASTVGVRLEPQANLLAYLLAGAEFGFAALSYSARTLTDTRSLRVILAALVVLHSTTAALELLAFAKGVNVHILGNVALRVLVVAILLYFIRRLLKGARA